MESKYEPLMSLLTTYTASELRGALVFLQEYAKSRNEVPEPAKYLQRYEARLRKLGATERDIEHSKLCKMRVMGLITKEEERARILALYGEGYLTS